MASVNVTRWTRQVLKRYRKEPPSLVLHLYPTHFRFEQQHGNFNYDSPMKCFLEAIREQRLPTDLLDVLDQANVRYYEGCLIVEVHDHRTTPAPIASTSTSNSIASGSSITRFPRQPLSFALTRDQPNLVKAEVYRIVLASNPATLWTDLGILNERWAEKTAAEDSKEGKESTGARGWTDEEALSLEAEILQRTMPPLCLSPSIQVTRVANTMLRATTLRPPKRKRFCGSGDDDEAGGESERQEREEREKMMKIGDEGVGRSRGNPFSRLAFIQAYRERTANPNGVAPVVPPTAVGVTPSVTSIRLISSSSTAQQAVVIPPPLEAGKRVKKKKQMPGTESDGAPPTKRKNKGSNAGSPDPDGIAEMTAERKRLAQKKRADAKTKKANDGSKYGWNG